MPQANAIFTRGDADALYLPLAGGTLTGALVVGQGGDPASVDGTLLHATNAGATAISVRDSTNDVETYLYAGSSGGIVGTYTNHPLAIRTNNTDRITVLSGGNVGIGQAAPGALLHVGAGADTPVTVGPALIVQQAGATSFVVRDATNDTELFGAAGSSGGFFGTATNHPVYLRTNNMERVTVLAGGNVGIGNVTPGALLHVGAGADTITIGGTAIAVQNAGATAIEIRNATDDVGLMALASTAGAILGTFTNHALSVRTNNTDRITVLAGGNVGVVNTNPGYPLHVGAGTDTLVRTETALAVQIAGAATITARNATNDVEATFIAGSSAAFVGTATNHPVNVLINNATKFVFDTSGNLAVNNTAAAISDGAGIDVTGKILRLRTSKTPASASDTGNAGEICWDSNYIYVTVGTNTWKRAALSTW